MEGSEQLQDRRDPDQDAAAEAALLGGTLPDEDRRAPNAGAEGAEDEEELVRRDIEDAARRHEEELGRMLDAEDAEDLGLVEVRTGEQAVSWEQAKRELGLESIAIAPATLAAVHQFLATLSGPEATRAAALRAQLPAVPE